MRSPVSCFRIAKRLTRAGLRPFVIAIVATGFVGEASASKAAWLTDSNSGSDMTSRLAFNSSSRPTSPSDFRRLADQSVREDAKEVHELHKAADRGDAHAQFDLGLLYESGRGVYKDTTEAIKWFRKAAEQGYDEAQYALGCCYNGDDGFPKDPVEAAKWWGKAAEQGYADAQYCLGLSYFSGEGVAKNPAEAAKWWKKAAEQGHADAQYFLGLSYSLGLGVPKIREQAIFWLRKAAANGNENATAALMKIGKVAT
jgi:TPR repeat protein